MSESMRERVARAIFEARAFGAPCKWVPDGNSLKQDDARGIADAVLEVMLEPTDGMLAAAVSPEMRRPRATRCRCTTVGSGAP